MQRSLTKGPITKGILLFALPLMFGNLLQYKNDLSCNAKNQSSCGKL